LYDIIFLRVDGIAKIFHKLKLVFKQLNYYNIIMTPPSEQNRPEDITSKAEKLPSQKASSALIGWLEKLVSIKTGLSDNNVVEGFEHNLNKVPVAEHPQPIYSSESELQRKGVSTLRELNKLITEVAQGGADKNHYLNNEIIGINQAGVQVRLHYTYHTADTTFIDPITQELENKIREELAEKETKATNLAELKKQVITHPKSTRNPELAEGNRPKPSSLLLTGNEQGETVSTSSDFGKLLESGNISTEALDLNRLNLNDLPTEKQKGQNKVVDEYYRTELSQRAYNSNPDNYPYRNTLRGRETGAFDGAMRCLAQGLVLSETQMQAVAKAQGIKPLEILKPKSIFGILNLGQRGEKLNQK
jgi:hypothetical protein